MNAICDGDTEKAIYRVLIVLEIYTANYNHLKVIMVATQIIHGVVIVE